MGEQIPEQVASFFLNPGMRSGDFLARWKKARLAAIRQVVSAEEGLDELALLAKIPSEHREQALRLVFDNSRKLARSLARMQSLDAEPSDFAELLPQSGIACYQGGWSERNGARTLSRAGCEGAANPFVCDYWREALDGLASGAGSDLRVARHRCAGRGDEQCLDVFFLDAGGAPEIGAHRGELPTRWKGALEKITAAYAAKGLELLWRGYSEGTLYYRLQSPKSSLCGAGGRLLHAALADEMRNLLPGVSLLEDAGRAVMGGAG